MTTYQSVEELKKGIIERYHGLSKRMKQVGKYVLDFEHDFAIETVAVIAKRSGVQPSAVVRFAKEFGFVGASSMQRLFRRNLISASAASSYRDRLLTATREHDADMKPELDKLLFGFLETSRESLQNQATDKLAAGVHEAAKRALAANTIYLTGHGRSFPISSYFAYAFSKAEKKCVLVDGIGGMGNEQIQACDENDLVVSTSFSPYSDETGALIDRAKTNGTPVVLLTDSEVSPIARSADQLLIVRDAEIYGFRSLSSSFCIAQAIVVSFVGLTDSNHD